MPAFGELAPLRTPRVDFLRGSMTIVEQLTEVNGQVIIGPPKTATSRRQIALPRMLTDTLAAHLEAYPAVDGYVFTSPEGTLLRRHNFRRRVFVPAVRASVGEPMRFHDLRHSHVAMLIALGQHPKVIQTRLRHSSIKVTLDQYGHLYEGLDEEAAARIDAARIDEMVAAIRAGPNADQGSATVLGLPTSDSETP